MAATEAARGLPDSDVAYDSYIERMRLVEYPMLKDEIYLDHAGTSLPNKSTLDAFHAEMLNNLYPNPHSASSSSQKTWQQVADTRLSLLRFVNASPDTFDIVFTANATASIKLVAEAFREQPGGFDYGYHIDSHTSVVGVRKLATRSRCIRDAAEMTSWRSSGPATAASPAHTPLFAYPAQSNMSGAKLPLSWCKDLRESGCFTLLDAASYAPTSPLLLDDILPDFAIVSMSKVFGFPDLGALIIRKNCASIFSRRKYFGGGTVDMVLCGKEEWHVRRTGALHEQLEDGSLPIHNILALKSAMTSHAKLFGPLDRIARHTMFLARKLLSGLRALKHANGSSAVELYSSYQAPQEESADTRQGPTVAFNLKDCLGQWISNVEVEKLATIKSIQLRIGSVCNPGGVAEALALEPWEMRQNQLAGIRCGAENDVRNGKPTGVIRASLGAMSTTQDVQGLLDFLDQCFVDHGRTTVQVSSKSNVVPPLQIESLIVYPVKSCAGWPIPHDMIWDIRKEGLAWDREWCIIHLGSRHVISQKSFPRMALIRPILDLRRGVLRLQFGKGKDDVEVPLSLDPSHLGHEESVVSCVKVCDDTIEARRYASTSIAEKLTTFLGTPCTLARFPASHTVDYAARHRKKQFDGPGEQRDETLLLSNESPILTITRSSLNALNEMLKAKGKRAAHHSMFRANIILAEPPQQRPGCEQPWAEDYWRMMDVQSPDGRRSTRLANLGGCRRCQMICVDQLTSEKRPEIFLTLAKHRRLGGRVLFGVHTALCEAATGRIQVGDLVRAT